MDLKENEFSLVVDTETTCFPGGGGWLGGDIISWSGIVIDKNLDVVDKATFLSRPMSEKYWTEGAEEVHGFSYYEACQFDHPRTTAINILNFLKPFKTENNLPLNWIEHSLNWIDFMFTFGLFYKEDIHFSMYKVLSENRRESTIKLARNSGYKKNGLDEWAKRVDYNLKHHDSESDAYCAYLTYKHIKERL